MRIEIPGEFYPRDLEGLFSTLIARTDPNTIILYEKLLIELKNKPIKIYKGFEYAEYSVKCPKCGTTSKLIDLVIRHESKCCGACLFPIIVR